MKAGLARRGKGLNKRTQYLSPVFRPVNSERDSTNDFFGVRELPIRCGAFEVGNRINGSHGCRVAATGVDSSCSGGELAVSLGSSAIVSVFKLMSRR